MHSSFDVFSIIYKNSICSMIDRRSYYSAKSIFEKLIPNTTKRNVFVNFLYPAIDLANSLNPSNWNLNLDLNGIFVRFNVGHEYCIEISKKELIIICNKTSLLPLVDRIFFKIMYFGHIKQKRILSESIESAPNCLAHTPNCVGCIINPGIISDDINILKQCNLEFIKAAIVTPISQLMKNAHSSGVITYLESLLNKSIPNPSYSSESSLSLESVIETQNNEEKKALKRSSEKRIELLKKADVIPQTAITSQTVFLRNQNVVAEVLYRANGICQKCKKTAPFLRDSDDRPYLEVHHIIPLASNGKDTVENAIALCPNCHRQAHYGKKSYNE